MTNQPIPYPLDYQFMLERTVRSRLEKLRAEGRTRELEGWTTRWRRCTPRITARAPR